MRYALLCYNSESAIIAMSRREEERMLERIAKAEDKISRFCSFGPCMRLMPTTSAISVLAGGEPALDGAYVETREQLLGFWTIECRSLDDAMEAARLLAAERQFGAIELRPIREHGSRAAAPGDWS